MLLSPPCVTRCVHATACGPHIVRRRRWQPATGHLGASTSGRSPRGWPMVWSHVQALRRMSLEVVRDLSAYRPRGSHHPHRSRMAAAPARQPPGTTGLGRHRMGARFDQPSAPVAPGGHHKAPRTRAVRVRIRTGGAGRAAPRVRLTPGFPAVAPPGSSIFSMPSFDAAMTELVRRLRHPTRTSERGGARTLWASRRCDGRCGVSEL